MKHLLILLMLLTLHTEVNALTRSQTMHLSKNNTNTLAFTNKLHKKTWQLQQDFLNKSHDNMLKLKVELAKNILADIQNQRQLPYHQLSHLMPQTVPHTSKLAHPLSSKYQPPIMPQNSLQVWSVNDFNLTLQGKIHTLSTNPFNNKTVIAHAPLLEQNNLQPTRFSLTGTYLLNNSWKLTGSVTSRHLDPNKTLSIVSAQESDNIALIGTTYSF